MPLCCYFQCSHKEMMTGYIVKSFDQVNHQDEKWHNFFKSQHSDVEEKVRHFRFILKITKISKDSITFFTCVL